MIDLDQLDPDWTFAALHGQASKPGISSIQSNVENSQLICKCCFHAIYKDPVPLCENAKELEFLGFGFPLFFTFLKNCIILLLIFLCSYCALSLKYAIVNNYAFCHGSIHSRVLSESSGTCDTFMVDFSRIEHTVTGEDEVLRISSFIIHLMFLIYMRDNIYKLEAYYDERNTSLSDFSIIIKKIPKTPKIQAKLRNFFQKQFTAPHEIKQITLLPQYPEIDALFKQKFNTIDRLRPFYDDGKFDETAAAYTTELKNIDTSIHQLARQSYRMAKNDQLECENVILIFNTDEEKEEILDEFPKMKKQKIEEHFGANSQGISIEEAPEPKEIIWKNINLNRNKRIGLSILGWGLSLLLLVVVTVIFYFILEQKSLNLIQSLKHLHEDPLSKQYKAKYNGAVALVYVLLFSIVLFNKLIMVVLFHKFTEIQRPTTTSEFQFSFALKYCLGLFFTTAIMTLAVEAIRFNNYYSHPYGVIDEETIMFFLNAFFVPLFWLVNPFQVAKIIKRSLNYGKKSLTQGEANFLMEETQYDLGKRYAEIIETMWFTFLYSTLIPIGAFISVIGIAIYYWVDKYNLLRRSSVSNQVSGQLCKTSMTLLDFTLILKPIGAILFDKQLRNQFHASSIVMICIGFVYLIIPMDAIIEFFHSEKFKPEQKSYEEVRDQFKDTYHTEHPVYRLVHGERMYKKLSIRSQAFQNAINTTESNLVAQQLQSRQGIRVNRTESKLIENHE